VLVLIAQVLRLVCRGMREVARAPSHFALLTIAAPRSAMEVARMQTAFDLANVRADDIEVERLVA
jgi:hypothetical protein